MKLIITPQFQSFLSSINIQMRDILEKAELPNKLWQDEIEYDAAQYLKLVKILEEEISDEVIYSISQLVNVKMLVPPYFSALSCRNGLEALERIETYRKSNGSVLVHVEDLGDTVSIQFSYMLPDKPLPRFLIINQQLLLLDVLRTGTGVDIHPISVTTPYPYEDILHDTFACPIQIDADNQMLLVKADLERYFSPSHNMMWSYLESLFDQNYTFSPVAEDSMTAKLRRELKRSIPSGKGNLNTLAKRLDTSSRTLQRKLVAEGTSFNKELQEVQKAMVCSYLQLRLSTEDILYLLGYAESSSLLRAFKRWTGMTFKQYQTKLLTEPNLSHQQNIS